MWLNTHGDCHVKLSRQSRAAETDSGKSSHLRRTEVNISVKSGSVQRGLLAVAMAVIYQQRHYKNELGIDMSTDMLSSLQQMDEPVHVSYFTAPAIITMSPAATRLEK